MVVSHPARGAWIEISARRGIKKTLLSHPARGAWIEIFMRMFDQNKRSGRTPQGVRGLKYAEKQNKYLKISSHPARGAWIEI